MNGFAGLRILALESRRAEELSKLIASYGGEAIVAPAMREVPLASNQEARTFVRQLLAGNFDVLILLTGVGTRALTNVADSVCPREQFIAALKRIKLIPRGPKPVAVLRELGVTPTLTVPEPNTWRELLQVLDGAAKPPQNLELRGMRVAVQEYGISNPELLAGLEQRGARVTRVPVYQWALPDDVSSLRAAIKQLADGAIDVVLFTTSVQVTHLFQVAAEMKEEERLRNGLAHAMIASIGPTTSEELSRHGVRPDFEPSHPKMGFLVKEAAEGSAEILRRKRAGTASA
jgi:uroporphyrinogen-III synthase